MTTADPVAELGADVTDHRLTRPDGRIVAWSESGVAGGRPILRIPGTPGSRLSLRADRTIWFERDLRVITTERPGFGASTRLPGRGFVEHADDLAAILDELSIDKLPVYGASGASPHILSFAGRHPTRVTAATIMVGAAPLTADEAAEMIDLNRIEYELFHAGRLDEIWRITAEVRESLLTDPLASFQSLMETAPEADRQVIGDPAWQRGFVIGVTEALRSDPGGWYDEGLAMEGTWDFDPASVSADVTWWHSDGDRNAPVSAAARLVKQLPNGRLHVWRESGHLTPYRHEAEVLDELLARA